MDPVPLARLLSAALVAALEDLHDELARHGHDKLRPVHGYALVAIADGTRTASAIAPRLGMTKQGAAKVLTHLLDEGYVEQRDDGGGDARRRPFALTRRGRAAVDLSVRIQAGIEQEWAAQAGARRTVAMREALERVVAARAESTGELPPVRPGW